MFNCIAFFLIIKFFLVIRFYQLTLILPQDLRPLGTGIIIFIHLTVSRFAGIHIFSNTPLLLLTLNKFFIEIASSFFEKCQFGVEVRKVLRNIDKLDPDPFFYMTDLGFVSIFYMTDLVSGYTSIHNRSRIRTHFFLHTRSRDHFST